MFPPCKEPHKVKVKTKKVKVQKENSESAPSILLGNLIFPSSGVWAQQSESEKRKKVKVNKWKPPFNFVRQSDVSL